MDYLSEFKRMMAEQSEIALATTAEDGPNVRIVNFYYDTNCKVLYFISFQDNQKVSEIEQHPAVAFTTLSRAGEEHVRVKNATARISPLTPETLQEKFLEKQPGHLVGIPEVLPALVVLEVTFAQADVVLDFEHEGAIVL
ncbi:pyridoxamine 5'-phosphate oxidase family protein [Gordonibacter sp.]|uniref:pyridoxamine 5'-phosphate oxidase family protein n=1 Tax=Gordonibacter sp. TaxID=1968902 RepID=UPI002FC61F77